MSGLNTDHDNVLRVDVGEDALVGKPGWTKSFFEFYVWIISLKYFVK